MFIKSGTVIVSNIQVSFSLPWNIVTKTWEYKGSKGKIGKSLLGGGLVFFFKVFPISQSYPRGRIKYVKEKGI